MCKEAGMNISYTVIDGAYGIGNTNANSQRKKIERVL